MNLLSLLARAQLARQLGQAAATHGPRLASPTARKWIWGLALTGLALWSLLAWGAFALLDGGGEWLAAQAGALGGYAPWLEGGVAFAGTLLAVAAWTVWGLGAVAILAGAWLLPRLAGAAGRLLTR